LPIADLAAAHSGAARAALVSTAPSRVDMIAGSTGVALSS
jgi:hypothetical protein